MVTTLPSTIELEVAVSWSGDGTFTGDHDIVTSDVRAEPGVAVDEGRDGAQTLSPPKVQAGSFTLRNERGVYSQDRADSPVYQRVIPGLPVQYQVRHGERRLYRSHTLYREHVPYRGLAVFPLGRHVVDDIDPDTAIGNRQVSFSTLGYEVVLTRAIVSVAVMIAPRVDECVTALLDAVGWPADQRDISVSDTTLTYWWCDERHPWDALLELLASEGPGTFYVDRAGVFHFESRNYRTITTRSTTSQATFFDRVFGNRMLYRSHNLYRAHRLYRGRTTGLYFTSFKANTGLRNIYNRATYATKRRTLGSLAAVWSYGVPFTLAASQTRTLIARPTDPFINAVSPALTTDYTVGGGTVSVTLGYTSGIVAFITVTATSGTPTVTGLQLRAQSLSVVSETVVENSVDASASITKFSPIPGEAIPITYSVPGWPEIDPAFAEAVCDSWVTRYMVQRPGVTFTLENATPELVAQILTRMPSDRVTLQETNSGMTADVWINSLNLHVSGAGGRTVALVVGAERCEELAGGVWDFDVWDGAGAIWGV